jgi:hypothetical protein
MEKMSSYFSMSGPAIRIGEAEIERGAGVICIKTPYDEAFVSELKSRTASRRWNGRCWVVDEREEAAALEVVRRHFEQSIYAYVNGVPLKAARAWIEIPEAYRLFELAEGYGLRLGKCYNGICRVYGDAAALEALKKDVEAFIGGLRRRLYVAYFEDADGQGAIVTFGRDSYAVKTSPLFEHLTSKRFGDRGTKKSPVFTGVVVLSSLADPRDISRYVTDVLEFEDTPEERRRVIEAVKGNWEDWEELKERLTGGGGEGGEEEAPAPPRPPELKPLELSVEPPPVQPPPPSRPEPERQELVKVYLLSMRLPSRYADQEVKWEGGKVEIRRFGAIAPKLETLRVRVYSQITRIFAYVAEYGVWIAVTQEAVEEARRIGEEVKKRLRELGMPDDFVERYEVRAIPVYLEPDEAKRLLQRAVERLSKDILELEERIKKAKEEGKKLALKRLEQEIAYKKALLEAFRRYISSF